jgi:hypothetical protein
LGEAAIIGIDPNNTEESGKRKGPRVVVNSNTSFFTIVCYRVNVEGVQAPLLKIDEADCTVVWSNQW